MSSDVPKVVDYLKIFEDMFYPILKGQAIISIKPKAQVFSRFEFGPYADNFIRAGYELFCDAFAAGLDARANPSPPAEEVKNNNNCLCGCHRTEILCEQCCEGIKSSSHEAALARVKELEEKLSEMTGSAIDFSTKMHRANSRIAELEAQKTSAVMPSSDVAEQLQADFEWESNKLREEWCRRREILEAQYAATKRQNDYLVKLMADSEMFRPLTTSPIAAMQPCAVMDTLRCLIEDAIVDGEYNDSFEESEVIAKAILAHVQVYSSGGG